MIFCSEKNPGKKTHFWGGKWKNPKKNQKRGVEKPKKTRFRHFLAKNRVIFTLLQVNNRVFPLFSVKKPRFS